MGQHFTGTFSFFFWVNGTFILIEFKFIFSGSPSTSEDYRSSRFAGSIHIILSDV